MDCGTFMSWDYCFCMPHLINNGAIGKKYALKRYCILRQVIDRFSSGWAIGIT